MASTVCCARFLGSNEIARFVSNFRILYLFFVFGTHPPNPSTTSPHLPTPLVVAPSYYLVIRCGALVFTW